MRAVFSIRMHDCPRVPSQENLWEIPKSRGRYWISVHSRGVEALIQKLDRTKAHEHFPVRFDDVRRVLVCRFPYAVYFYHDDMNVFVTYVFHMAQNPRKLLERPRNPNQAMEDTLCKYMQIHFSCTGITK